VGKTNQSPVKAADDGMPQIAFTVSVSQSHAEVEFLVVMSSNR
jgi:hypothetical protein